MKPDKGYKPINEADLIPWPLGPGEGGDDAKKFHNPTTPRQRLYHNLIRGHGRKYTYIAYLKSLAKTYLYQKAISIHIVKPGDQWLTALNHTINSLFYHGIIERFENTSNELLVFRFAPGIDENNYYDKLVENGFKLKDELAVHGQPGLDQGQEVKIFKVIPVHEFLLIPKRKKKE